MKLDKNAILDMLRNRGDHERANRADQELPDEVDHEEHSGLLGKLGLDPKDVLRKVKGR
jgi:hypothetical protein